MKIDFGRMALNTIAAIKDISVKRLQLNPENLSNSLAGQQDLQNYFKELTRTTPAPAMSDDAERQGRLGREVRRLAERNELLSQTLSTVIRLARKTDAWRDNQALADLQKALVENLAFDRLEQAAASLKSDVIEMELAGAGKAAGPVPDTSSQPKNNAWLEEARFIYLEFINGLDLDLGEDYQDGLHAIRTHVSKATDLSRLLSNRDDVEQVVRGFAQRIFDDRRRAAQFISEVARRLSDLEQHILLSAAQIREGYSDNATFQARLEKEISQTTSNVKSARQLEELKHVVLTKLMVISEAVKGKRSKDKDLKKAAERSFGNLHKKFDSVRLELIRADEEHQILSQRLTRDCLTGVFNRYAYEDHINGEFDRYKRYGRIFSLILFDVDEFKTVNDNFGHLIGDRCLRETADTVQSLLRQNDILARYGGDEFVVVLPETEREHAAVVAEKIRSGIAMTDLMVKGRKVPFSVSVGVSQVEPSDMGKDAVFSRVDQALYLAKRNGRNRISII